MTPLTRACVNLYYYSIVTMSISYRSVKQWHDLEIWVRGNLRLLEISLFNRSHIHITVSVGHVLYYCFLYDLQECFSCYKLLNSALQKTWIILDISQTAQHRCSTNKICGSSGRQGASLVKERSCGNTHDRSRHLQEHSRSFSNHFAPRALS